VVVLGGQGDLFEVVRALHPIRGLANLLHGREQQADQDRDDGDHDQQLDECEGPALVSHVRTPGVEGKKEEAGLAVTAGKERLPRHPLLLGNGAPVASRKLALYEIFTSRFGLDNS
jgi:hypothetical protein